MDITMLILTFIGTAATIISTILAFRAKNEAKQILKDIKQEKNRNISSSGQIDMRNTGTNLGIISGINTGDISDGNK